MVRRSSRKEFPGRVGGREQRKMQGMEGRREVWFGLGMFGVVGWSVTLPAVVGTLIGAWLDTSKPGRYSWTLMLLAVGLAIGCANAWYWVQRERQSITGQKEKDAGRK